ncbi:DNA/RNA polymerase [Rhizophagus irregularis]|uniref:DNA polymerase n=1 Tax=Rhizophagus irregularis TaxID=588596 RepID=A0A2N1M831_9GLOM|nr:DNA/RNA polymerase [Rhizophagus irregularis]
MTEHSKLSEFLSSDVSTFFHPEAEKDKTEGQVIRYSGEKYLSGIPTRDNIVAENDEGLIAILEDALFNCQEIPFMATDNEGSSQKINGKYCYVLRLYGSLINGQKAIVTLLGIQVFFDVLVPDGEILDECKMKTYLRIYMSGTGKRKIAIKAVQDNNYETASDDLYSFHRKVARENGIQLSGWSMLGNYMYKKRIDPLCPHTFYLFKKYFQPVKDLTTITDHFPISALRRDRTVVLTWDIETQSQELGEFAEVLNLKQNVFMICMTLHWKDDPKPLKQICLVDIETEPDPRWTTIVCGNKENLLKAFALCWRAFAPDIQVGFNDSDYDWHFIMERAYHLNILEWIWERMTGKFETKEEILKWKYRGKIGAKSENTFKKKERKKNSVNTDSENTLHILENGEEDTEVKEFLGGLTMIKISAEDNFFFSFLKLPGCVPIDVRVCLKKRYPHSEVEKEGSLKFFLQKCGLDAKADMPYDKMWKIYSEAKKSPSSSTVRKMREVAYYCIIDALRCQELLVKLSQINEYREVASIAYISLFDSHYRANGMKVQNLLGAYAFKRDMLFSARIPEKVEKGKYPSAYVFPPKKGIETKRPVMGLDFASLYPSLIMAYNLSPEKFIFNPEEAVIIKKNGNGLHEISFPFNKRTIQAWCELSAMRQELKAQLASLGKKKDQLEKIISSVKEKGKRIPEKLDLEYKSLCFEYDCLNSKQKAVKLFMNTFYGEAGNPLSSIFLCALAGRTTSAGKYNIKLVAEYVEKKGFGIKYGDTDSLYLTCPDKYFEKCDEAFSKKELSKEAYWTEMVKITMDVMKKLRDQINAYLRIKSGTSYLKMAYEEVLFPVCFTGKKKYFGVRHEDVVNFKPKNLFMKGIETVKQDTLREARNKEWDFNDFIVMGTWKPKKKNLCNNCFMERMKEKNERIPDPGERFSYVIVKGPRLRNEKGRLIPYRVGDYMEYAGIAKEKNMEIDINYYLGTTVRMYARFINEDDRYQPLPSHKIMQLKYSNEKEKQTDKYSQDEATKWLKKYIKGLQ